MNFVEELRWRGMIHNLTPGIEALLEKETVNGYIGVDPTSTSLHVGNLAALMMLMHLQRAGHRPVVLVGGATGMVGDPSGKSAERNLLDEQTLNGNVAAIKMQMQQLFDFSNPDNGAILVNNYDWFKNMDVLSFLRDIGKHISINYMTAKDSVKKRLETGLSFTEFSYQLIQGYDFAWLHQNKNCKLQMGGSDQWGNITTGTELVRRMYGGEAHAITCPLITKADGTKFGKTEKGAVYLAPEMTSPYEFYQYWLNASDVDAQKYIRIFTFLDQVTIEGIEATHAEAPHTRTLQKRLAQEVTTMIHGAEAYDTALKTSQILFGRSNKETLLSLSEKQLLAIFEGVPQFTVAKGDIEAGMNILELVGGKTSIFPSKGQARKNVQGIKLNQEKISGIDHTVTAGDLIQGKYLLIRRGKKNYNLIVAA
ncbi:MAG: tyrosine--tRNA ligase [Chitinophagales bacterium]